MRDDKEPVVEISTGAPSTGVDAFWGFALVSIVSLALTAALPWAVVLP